ncbi:unnamed protein product, partial [marine sediment metagenome]
LKSKTKETAFHEIAELLLTKLSTLGAERYIGKEDIETAKHEIVRRLENCIYRKQNR